MNKSKDKITKERLDVLLVKKGYFDTREKARIAIMEGKVLVNNQKEDKAGSLFKEDATISLLEDPIPYVSRGGLKLKKAIDCFDIDLKDKTCLDIGASTGGFTDVMLKGGAKKVFAVDCGTNQLDYKLRKDERVISLENLNARYMKKTDIAPSRARYARRMTIPVSSGASPYEMLLIIPLAWDRGMISISCLKPSGISSVEKNVLHRNDIGMMMYVLNLGASEYVLARKDKTSASVANTMPFRIMITKDSQLKIRPCLTGIVSMRMTNAAYRPLRLPPST